MGWFSSSNKEKAEAQQGTAPTRESRQACWSHRDKYFQCLASHDILIPPGTDMSDGRGPPKAPRETTTERETDPCIQHRSGYEKNCAQSWVEYFNKRRVMEERQKLMYAQSGQRQL